MLTKFEEYKQEEKKLSDFKKSICKTIDDFINYDTDFQKNHDLKGYKYSFEFYFDSRHDKTFVVQYYKKGEYSGYQQEVHFTFREYNNLLKFMEDPELYKNAKNYNL